MAGQAGYQQPGGLGYNDPTKPPPSTGDGNWVWDALKGAWSFLSNNAGTIANAAGSALQAYETEQQTKEKLAEQKAEFGTTSAQQAARDAAQQAQAAAALKEQQTAREQSGGQFNRTTGDTEAQSAVRAQTQLNQSPLADKAQALILARMGVSPGAFQPRDITRGVSDLSRNSVAPGANVATTLQKAAAGYKPGQGGVDTSVLRSLIAKLTGSSGLQGTPPTQPTEGFPAPTNPISHGPTPPDIRPRPITPTLHLPVTTGPIVGAQPLPPKIPFNNPIPTPTQPVVPVVPDDAGGGSDQEPDANDPTEILKRKMQLAY